VSEIMCKKYSRSGQATDDNMVHAHCIPKTKNTYTKYVMFIASPLQYWLYESTLILCYMYIACLDCVLLRTS